MRDTCRQYVDEVVAPWIREDRSREWSMDPEARLAPHILEKADEIGLRYLGVPEEFGGIPLDADTLSQTFAVISTELARGDSGLADKLVQIRKFLHIRILEGKFFVRIQIVPVDLFDGIVESTPNHSGGVPVDDQQGQNEQNDQDRHGHDDAHNERIGLFEGFKNPDLKGLVVNRLCKSQLPVKLIPMLFLAVDQRICIMVRQASLVYRFYQHHFASARRLAYRGMCFFHLADDAIFSLSHLLVDVAIDLQSKGIVKCYNPEKIDKQGDRQKVKRGFCK